MNRDDQSQSGTGKTLEITSELRFDGSATVTLKGDFEFIPDEAKGGEIDQYGVTVNNDTPGEMQLDGQGLHYQEFGVTTEKGMDRRGKPYADTVLVLVSKCRHGGNHADIVVGVPEGTTVRERRVRESETVANAPEPAIKVTILGGGPLDGPLEQAFANAASGDGTPGPGHSPFSRMRQVGSLREFLDQVRRRQPRAPGDRPGADDTVL